MKLISDKNLESLIYNYYKKYYKNDLGLKDWRNRVKLRIDEENNFSQDRNVKLLENIYNLKFEKKSILIVGSGTGGECIYFSKKKMKVEGIEPNKEANKIANKKIKLLDLKNINIHTGVSEDLPFNDNEFDFVYCYTVLEHVENVKKSISEMIRVLQPGGGFFICSPDYRQFYEPHYKLPLPMFLPKIIIKILLKLLARPTTFLDTLNLFNEKDINKILNQYNVTATRIYEHIPKEWENHPSFQIKIIKYITKKFGIHKNQYWFIKKNDKTN